MLVLDLARQLQVLLDDVANLEDVRRVAARGPRELPPVRDRRVRVEVHGVDDHARIVRVVARRGGDFRRGGHRIVRRGAARRERGSSAAARVVWRSLSSVPGSVPARTRLLAPEKRPTNLPTLHAVARVRELSRALPRQEHHRRRRKLVTVNGWTRKSTRSVRGTVSRTAGPRRGSRAEKRPREDAGRAGRERRREKRCDETTRRERTPRARTARASTGVEPRQSPATPPALNALPISRNTETSSFDPTRAT
eukprot:31349-Pelagococcus_subviridis.AAC.9